MSSEKSEEAELPHTDLWVRSEARSGWPTQYLLMERLPGDHYRVDITLAWVLSHWDGQWSWGTFTGANGLCSSLAEAQLAAEKSTRQTAQKWVALLSAPTEKEET